MRTSYCLLVILRFATAYKIITKSMIHSPEDLWYEPVPLKTKDELTTERLQISTIEPSFESLKSDLGLEQSIDPIGRSVDLPTTISTTIEEEESSEDDNNEEYEDDFTTTEANQVTTPVPDSTKNRTKLYPVGRLWERTHSDIWSIISEAFGCIWSGVGLDCFTYRVVPMFKSMMGYPPYNQPFLLPRQLSEDGEIEGRIKKRHGGMKLMKTALLGLVGLKALLLPILVGLALISGKALFVSLLSTILTAAAAWTSAKTADRRVQTESPSQNFYM